MKCYKFLMVIVILMTMIGCAVEGVNNNGNEQEQKATTIPYGEARVIETKTYEDIVENTEIMENTAQIVYPVSSLVNLNFVYPYKDPNNKDVMLSGTISIPKVLYDATSDKQAWGFMLYNHYTIMRANQCPSKGALREVAALGVNAVIGGTSMPIGIKDHKIIVVSADYYGFGCTEWANQYYCAGEYNARCSLEALKAAKQILTDLGYIWGDYLLNAGYSQGGQTSMAVQKLVDTDEYDVTIDATFAGAGPYNLTSTWSAYIDAKDETSDTSVAICPVLAFNEYNKLNLNYSDLFADTLVSNIDNWFI